MTELRQTHDPRHADCNYSPRTIQVYVYHAGCFAKFCGKSPLQLGPEDIRRYQVHLVEHKKVLGPASIRPFVHSVSSTGPRCPAAGR